MNKEKKYIQICDALKLYCKETCSAGDQSNWEKCTVKECPLHKYRLGDKNE